jgi:hypothetical protein
VRGGSGAMRKHKECESGGQEEEEEV